MKKGMGFACLVISLSTLVSCEVGKVEFGQYVAEAQNALNQEQQSTTVKQETLSLTTNVKTISLNILKNETPSTTGFYTSRVEFSSALLPNGKAIFTGGNNYTGTQYIRYSNVDIFDPEANGKIGAWSSGPALQISRSSHTTTLLKNGKVIVVGGNIGEGSTQSTPTTEIFDPAANNGAGAWSFGPSLTLPRGYHTATLLKDGRLLVAGGFLGGVSETNTVEIFDPNANNGAGAWSQGPTMKKLRWYHKAILLDDGRVLVCGGFANNSNEIFDPLGNNGAGSWTQLPDITGTSYGHTLTKLKDGRVLRIGGNYNGPSGNTVFIFDTKANNGVGAFTAGPTMPSKHRVHTANLLQDGRVLIAGGIDQYHSSVNTTKIFDPYAAGNGSWSNGPAMNSPHYNHASETLLDGRVIIYAGASTGYIGSTTIIPLNRAQLKISGGTAPYTLRVSDPNSGTIQATEDPLVYHFVPSTTKPSVFVEVRDANNATAEVELRVQ